MTEEQHVFANQSRCIDTVSSISTPSLSVKNFLLL